MADPAIVQDGASSVGLGDAGKRVMEQYGLEKEISKAEKAQSAAKKAGEAQIMSQYGSVLSKPYEEFKPSQESASGFAALGSLLMVAGGMMGGKGRLAGIGAMNNIAGMMKGYQQGRKDLYEQERTQFEENMKVFEKNRTLIKEAFDRALKMAPYNLTTAQNNLRKELAGLGATIPAEMTAKSGLVQAAGQHDTFHTNTTNTLQSLKDKLGLSLAQQKAYEADVKAKKESLTTTAEEALIAERKATAAKAERLGGKTEAQIERQKELQNIAEGLKANNKTPTTEKEIEAWQATYKDQPFPVPRYGLHAFIDSALGSGASSGLKDKDLTDIKSSVDAINQTNNILKKAQDPEIKFGSVPTLWENIKQKWRANFDGMGLKDNSQLSYESKLPNGQTVGDYLADEIRATPVDPNDKNAVFQKEAAFTALAIERAARGGSMLPLGFIKTLGPLLDPKQYTRKAYNNLMAGRVGELETSLGNYQFNKEDINKLLNRSSELMGTKTTEPAAPAAPVAPSVPVASLKDIEFTAQKYGKTVDEIKKILRDAGRKIEGE